MGSWFGSLCVETMRCQSGSAHCRIAHLSQVPPTPFICLRNPHAIHFIALGVYCTSCSLHYVCAHSIAPAVYCTAVYCTSYSSHCTNCTSEARGPNASIAGPAGVEFTNCAGVCCCRSFMGLVTSQCRGVLMLFFKAPCWGQRQKLLN